MHLKNSCGTHFLSPPSSPRKGRILGSWMLTMKSQANRNQGMRRCGSLGRRPHDVARSAAMREELNTRAVLIGFLVRHFKSVRTVRERSWPCKASQKSGNLNLQHQRVYSAERQCVDWALMEQRNLSYEELPAFHTLLIPGYEISCRGFTLELIG